MARLPELDPDYILAVVKQNVAKGKPGREFFKDAGFKTYRSFQKYLSRNGISIRDLKKNKRTKNERNKAK